MEEFLILCWTIKWFFSQIVSRYPEPEHVAKLRANKHKAEVYCQMSSLVGKHLKKPQVMTWPVTQKNNHQTKKISGGIMKGGTQGSPTWMIYLILSCWMSIIIKVFFTSTRHTLQSVMLAKWQFVKIHGKEKKNISVCMLEFSLLPWMPLRNSWMSLNTICGKFYLPPVTQKADIIKIIYHWKKSSHNFRGEAGKYGEQPIFSHCPPSWEAFIDR